MDFVKAFISNNKQQCRVTNVYFNESSYVTVICTNFENNLLINYETNNGDVIACLSYFSSVTV